MKTAFMFHHLLVLVQTFFELRTETPSCRDYTPAGYVCIPMDTLKNNSFCTIPVRMPRTKEETVTLVSPEDYSMLVGITPVWHVSSSGYIVTSKRIDGINKITYMHKMVSGKPSAHINGDKFDNRRSNLVVSQRGAKRQRSEEIDIDIRTVSPLLDFVLTPEDVPSESRHSTIQYTDEMVYHGEIHNYRPHGFGTLKEPNKTSIGWWMQGTFTNGLVMNLVPIPNVMRERGYVPQVRQAALIVDQKVAF